MADGSARATAARVVGEVVDKGRSLSQVMTVLGTLPVRERALAQEMVFGTIRWYFRLQPLLDRLLERPLRSKESDLRNLILVGLYQLAYLRIPPHAAVSETVKGVDRLGKPWARNLVNGVLRSFQRGRESLESSVDAEEVARFSHPRWFIDVVKEAWPKEWAAILEANNCHPPMSLRVNRLRGSREEYLARLREHGIEGHPSHYAPMGIVLDRPVGVEELPGFKAGDVSVQDGAAQLAAHLLDLKPGQRVLDACSAPGGKTAHILESEGSVVLTAVEKERERLDLVRETLGRLGLNAALVAGDAGEPQAWWDGALFDRILLDVPCSATGVIRRHPDIKLLRKEGDIDALAAEQARLLESVWPLLKPGGMLLYATCSIIPKENFEQVGGFLARTPEAFEIPLEADWGRATPVGREILPGEDEMDGFFYAAIGKR